LICDGELQLQLAAAAATKAKDQQQQLQAHKSDHLLAAVNNTLIFSINNNAKYFKAITIIFKN